MLHPLRAVSHFLVSARAGTPISETVDRGQQLSTSRRPAVFPRGLIIVQMD